MLRNVLSILSHLPTITKLWSWVGKERLLWWSHPLISYMIWTGEKLRVGGMGGYSLGRFSSRRGIIEGSGVPSLPDTAAAAVPISASILCGVPSGRESGLSCVSSLWLTYSQISVACHSGSLVLSHTRVKSCRQSSSSRFQWFVFFLIWWFCLSLPLAIMLVKEERSIIRWCALEIFMGQAWEGHTPLPLIYNFLCQVTT